MARAREEFLDRLTGLRSTSTQPYIVDLDPSHHEHNARARLLRNGLAVMGFTILEDFVRQRVGETTTFLAGVDVNFDDFPQKLRRSLTRGALSATLNLERTIDNVEDRVAFLMDEARVVGSSNSTVRSFSRYAFGWDRSNISADNVSHALSAFGVNRPWMQIDGLMRRFGFGVPDAQTEFINAAKRRHAAAHDPEANIQPTDIQSFSRAATGLAVSVDALISECTRRFQARDAEFIAQSAFVEANSILLRYLQEGSGLRWKEVHEGGTRAYRVHGDYRTAVRDAHARALRNREFLVVINNTGFVTDWRPHDG